MCIQFDNEIIYRDGIDQLNCFHAGISLMLESNLSVFYPVSVFFFLGGRVFYLGDV